MSRRDSKQANTLTLADSLRLTYNPASMETLAWQRGRWRKQLR